MSDQPPAVGTPQQLCDICERPLGDATTACPHCGTTFAVGTPPSADDQTDVQARYRNYLGNGGFFNPEMMEHQKVADLLRDFSAELTRLRAELASVRFERDLNEQNRLKGNEYLIGQRDALKEEQAILIENMRETVKEHDRYRDAYTALLIDLCTIVERYEAKRQDEAQRCREANHNGNKELDAYHDGKAMALGDVLSELAARLSREPHQDTPQ